MAVVDDYARHGFATLSRYCPLPFSTPIGLTSRRSADPDILPTCVAPTPPFPCPYFGSGGPSPVSRPVTRYAAPRSNAPSARSGAHSRRYWQRFLRSRFARSVVLTASRCLHDSICPARLAQELKSSLCPVRRFRSFFVSPLPPFVVRPVLDP